MKMADSIFAAARAVEEERMRNHMIGLGFQLPAKEDTYEVKAGKETFNELKLQTETSAAKQFTSQVTYNQVTWRKLNESGISHLD